MIVTAVSGIMTTAHHTCLFASQIGTAPKLRGYNRDNPDGKLTLERAVRSYSFAPSIQMAGVCGKKKQQERLHSEGMAEAAERIVGGNVGGGSFLSYVRGSIVEEVRRHG